MVKTVIKANPTEIRTIPEKDREAGRYLDISECFFNTIQGENFTGNPAAFLRLQGCTLNCVWCDTREVWRYGNSYTFDELFALFIKSGMTQEIGRRRQRLVLTGGSPLKQQDRLLVFLQELFTLCRTAFSMAPVVEIENEGVIMPDRELGKYIHVWNNSLKLSNSRNDKEDRYKPGVIKYLSCFNEAWFKFVVRSLDDWTEIQESFLRPNLIGRGQIVLMPQGATKAELDQTRQVAVELAVREGVRFTDRLHVTIWDKKTGV